MLLRYYQQESIHELREGFKKHKRQVLCLPTGAGKTVVFSEMVRLAAAKGTVTLVLTDRTELFKQTVRALGRVGVAVEEIAPGKRLTDTGATIFLAMVETIKRRAEVLRAINPGLIIIDEAHKGNFTAILESFPDARVIGATATPVGKHFETYYQNIVQNIDVPELVSEGFLVNCKAFKMVDDFSDLKIKRGEFTEQSLNAHFNVPTLYNGMIQEWKRLGPNLKTIVFNVSIEHTINTHNAFIDAGVSSEYITSKTPREERNRILQAFSSGAFQVLNNCGILTTGYDEPSIEFVVMNRATQSLPLWLQCVGRGSRLIDSSIGGLTDADIRLEAIAASRKPHFLLLDCGGNHDRLGLWNEPRTWSLEQRKKREGVAPVKECPQCHALIPGSARACSFCGAEIEVKPKEAPKEGKTVPVIPTALVGKRIDELTTQELVELQKSGKYKPSFIWRVMRARGIEALREYAKLMEYRSGWVSRQIKLYNMK